MGIPLRIFIIYAREDESFKSSLLSAFIPLRRAGKVEVFHDALIKPGDRWEDVILDNLRKAHIIMPLVSNDFFASEFIHEVEFKKAVDRYTKGETVIIPVILKHCGWKYDPIIKTLQVLPKDGKPVVTWAFHEEAWEQVLDAVHEVTYKATKKVSEKNRLEAELLFDLGLNTNDYYKKIEYYSKSIELNSECSDAYCKLGEAKSFLGHDADAIKDFDQAIRLKPEDPDAYIGRASAKSALGHNAEAIEDYDQAVIRLNSKDSHSLYYVYFLRGRVNEELELFEKAKKDYQKALSIDPNNSFVEFYLEEIETKIKQKF